MAGNFTPAPSNDIDWLGFMDHQMWSEMPETGLNFMQGAEAGLGGADYESQGSSHSTIPPLKSAAIDSPINQQPHHDAIIRHGTASHACVTGQAYSSTAGNSDHRVGVNFDSILDSAALDSTLGIGLDARNEDFVPSSPEEEAVTTAQADTIEASDSDVHETCACITCLNVGVWDGSKTLLMCRVPDCYHSREKWYTHKQLRDHELQHFAPFYKWLYYHCAKPDCRYKSEKFRDLLRHTTSKHCTNPNARKWPCTEIGCKYSGSNGFTRKDKLKSHRETCHAGKAMPGKPYRVIKPASGGKQPAGAISVPAVEKM